MQRSKIQEMVSGALRVPPDHEAVKEIMGYGYVTVTKGWDAWPWLKARRVEIEHAEGGRWGLAWLVIARATALLASRRAIDTKHATFLAQREVCKELRAEYDGQVSASASLGELFEIAYPRWDEMDVSRSAAIQVAKLYSLASNEERQVLDLYDQGYSGTDAAAELGVTLNAVFQRTAKLRKKAKVA